jgi:proteasome assembly chaperone (PAC2) family protein
MGEVAFKLGLYIRDMLKMEEFAALEAPELFPPTGIWIEKNLIQLPKSGAGKFYFYKSKSAVQDVILFLSDAQPLLEHSVEYCKKILSVSREFKVNRVITFAAMPQAIDHSATPEVWYSATSKEIVNELQNLNIGLKALSAGQVSGLNGLFLGIAKEHSMEGICLLGEIPLFAIQIENPKGSLAILEKLEKILKIEVDGASLREQAKFMEQEIDKLINFIQSPQQYSGPISHDEIDKIKKSLNLNTKLPQSARIKIEKLFSEAKQNIVKATELKKELDDWNVYKEYEDRFLDLFKRPKDSNEKKHH